MWHIDMKSNLVRWDLLLVQDRQGSSRLDNSKCRLQEHLFDTQLMNKQPQMEYFYLEKVEFIV